MKQLPTRRSVLVSAIALASVSPAKAMRDKGARRTESIAIVTSLGTISVAVDVHRAPLSAGNYLECVDRHLFDDAQFYRSVHPDNDANPVKISVLQGGIIDNAKRLAPIPHESTRQSGLRHRDGTISIARREPGTGSAGAFFICIGDQPGLDFGGRRNPDGLGFAAFGRVHEGMNVVRTIWMQQTEGTDGSIGAQRIASPVRIATIILFTSSSIIEPNRLRRALCIDVIKISTFSKSNAGEGVADFVAALHKKIATGFEIQRVKATIAIERSWSGAIRLEIILVLWEYGHMKTTLELPDGLMQRVKLRAVHRNQKLKDAIAQLLELGMAAAPDAEKLPRVPKPVRLKGGRLDIVAIEAAIAAGRE